MRKSAFYIGLVVIVISFIACVMSFYLLPFGIPSFVLGAIGVVLSKETVGRKLLTLLVPIVLFVPCTFLFLWIYNYSTPKTMLIPISMEGNLRVVYGEKCGNHYREIDGVKTLIIPENGILVLSEDFDRHLNYNYYLVDEMGKQTKMQPIFDANAEGKNRPYILPRGSGTMGQGIATNAIDQDKNGITFKDFSVYHKDSMERDNYTDQQRFDSLTTAIVNRCRQAIKH